MAPTEPDCDPTGAASSGSDSLREELAEPRAEQSMVTAAHSIIGQVLPHDVLTSTGYHKPLPPSHRAGAWSPRSGSPSGGG